MSYTRKTKDVYKIIWNVEEVDRFETFAGAKEMKKEYNIAFHGGCTIKKSRERI